MLKYSCIIVEDEPLAAEVLVDYIKQIPMLELRHVCVDAIFAMEVLQSEKIDLIFLDIELPKLTGLDFFISLKNPPKVIITSAYKEYALEGYELNVIDYLLKPIRFTRFLKSVNKLQNLENSFVQTVPSGSVTERKHLFFNVGKKRVRIFLDEILYMESLREYVRITTMDNSIVTKFQLNEIEDVLADKNFLRIHRSFLVAKDKISAFTASVVEINKKQIPIGRNYKELVITVLEQAN